MKRSILFLFSFFTVLASFSQREQKLVDDYLSLVNELRQNPAAFGTKYSKNLEDYPEFKHVLKTQKKLPAISFDQKLASSITRLLGGKYTESDFDGICGISGSETEFDVENFDDKQEILDYFFEILEEDGSNIFDPSIIKIGMDAKISGETVEMRFIYGSSCDLKTLRQAYTSTEKADTSRVDFARLNTAKNAAYLTLSEKQMVQEINFVRCYPKEYAAIVAAELSKRSAEKEGLKPDEFVALHELIAELKAMKPLTPLQASECISKAAKKHGADMKTHGFIAHDGSDGKEPHDRMKAACGTVSTSGENIGGGDETIRGKVIELLLDEGITGRGHRRTLLDKDWTHVGVHYVKKVGLIEDVWIQNFAAF
ncbi:MAG: CAP domain-containing protein [Bacteroidota bacterium]